MGVSRGVEEWWTGRHRRVRRDHLFAWEIVELRGEGERESDHVQYDEPVGRTDR